MTKFRIVLVAFILFVGLILRLHNYTIYPQRGASSDEYTYTFLGLSLLTKHIPISWSYFSPYKHKYNLTINKLYFPIVYPYFDHPPLTGFLTGGLSILLGQDTFEEIDLKTIRLVPIFLSMISSVFVFLLGLRLYGYKTAVWALLIYATTTIFVMNGRVVFAENLLTPLFLGALYLFVLWHNKLTDKKSLILGVLAGLSFWTKEVGVIVFITLMFLLITQRAKIKYTLVVMLIFFSFLLAYLGYGAYYDWEVFTGAITVQATRIVGPQTLQLLTSTPIIVNKVYYDGWYFLGMFAFFFSFFAYQKQKMLLVPAAAYFMLLIFSLTREGEMGWYMIPMFPFMALFTAHFLVEGLKKKTSWGIFVLLIFVGLAQIKLLYEDIFGLSTLHFRILLILLFAPSLIALLFKKERAFRIIGNMWFYLFILGNIFLTYNYIHPA